MIYVNERQENANLWRLAQHCQRQYRHYISDASESVIEQRFSNECDMAIGVVPRHESQKLAFIWWGLSLAYDFKKTRNSVLYAADFSSNKSGYQHFADALARFREDTQMIDAVLPGIVSGELNTADTTTLSRAEQNGTERANNPVLYEELLQEVVVSGEESRTLPLPAEKTVVIRQAYARLLYMDYVKKYIDVGYQVCRVFDKNREYREKLNSTFASLQQDDANKELINALSEELHTLYNAFRSCDIQASGIGDNRKMQRFDVFDHQISYLERIARAIEEKPCHDETDIFMPLSMRKLKPESVLLANLVYREIKAGNGDQYSNDFWIIPGFYQSILGIYGNHDTAPDLFFKTVLKDREAVGPANHPIEDIIVVSGHYMVKLNKKAWDSIVAVEKQHDAGASLQVEIEDERPLIEDDSGLCPSAGMDILWKQYENESQRKTPLQAIAKDIDKTEFFRIEDNGGTGAYKMICALQQGQRARKKETGNQEMLIRDIFWKDVARLPDLSNISQDIILFMKKMASQENILALNKQPLSLLSSNKSWDKITYKLLLGYLCWRNPEISGRRNLTVEVSENGSLVLSDFLTEAIHELPQLLSKYRQDLQDNSFVLMMISNDSSHKQLVLERKNLYGKALRAWLFADGAVPYWTKELKEIFQDSVQDAITRFIESKCGIDSGKRETFSRKSFTRITEFDALLRLLFGYALIKTNADHIVMWPTFAEKQNLDICYAPIIAEPDENKRIQASTIMNLCQQIMDKPESFDIFLTSIDQRSDNNPFQSNQLKMRLTVIRTVHDVSMEKKTGKSAAYLNLLNEVQREFPAEASLIFDDVLYKCYMTCRD